MSQTNPVEMLYVALKKRRWTYRIRGHVQNEENSKEENQNSLGTNDLWCWTNQIKSNPRLYQILQYLGVAQALKTNMKKTYSCKLDLKRLKPAPGSGLALSLFIYTPNSKPQVALVIGLIYSPSSPCNHSRKRPALVTTSTVKPRLNRHF